MTLATLLKPKGEPATPTVEPDVARARLSDLNGVRDRIVRLREHPVAVSPEVVAYVDAKRAYKAVARLIGNRFTEPPDVREHMRARDKATDRIAELEALISIGEAAPADLEAERAKAKEAEAAIDHKLRERHRARIQAPILKRRMDEARERSRRVPDKAVTIDADELRKVMRRALELHARIQEIEEAYYLATGDRVPSKRSLPESAANRIERWLND